MKVDCFYGDGFESTPEELGYDPATEWEVGDVVSAIPDYDVDTERETTEIFRIHSITKTERGEVVAQVFYQETL